MKDQNKSLHPDFAIPVFGIGTWMMGGKLERDADNDGTADSHAICQAIDSGLTHIDTAELYANGFAEEIVGKAITGYDRSKLFLVSKVATSHLRYDEVIKAAKQSLSRLKTPYLDLYLIHGPDPKVPMEETMRAMSKLKELGLIKNIGVSNFTVQRMQEAQSFIEDRIVATQVHYNLKFREPERAGLLDYCLKNKIIVIAWRPIQKGSISEENPKILDQMCLKYRKTPMQIAINWLISQPGIVTLSTMRSKNHLEENMGALGWKMEAGDIEKLRKEFPDQQPISDAVPLR